MQNNLEEQADLYQEETSVNYSSYIYPYRYKTVRYSMSGPDVLELGVGHGDFTKWLCQDGFNLTSVDGSRKNLDHAAKKVENLNNWNIVHALFDDFFDSNYGKRFNDILITNTLEHVDDPVNFLMEASVLLRPKGSIHITVPNAMSFHRLLGVRMGLIKRPYELNEHDYSVGHKRVYDFSNLDRDIYDANLFVAETDGIMFKPFSNSQLWPMIQKNGKIFTDGLYDLGRHQYKNAAEIYKRCIQ